LPRDPAHWPEYCCAILRDVEGRYLLERRPTDAKDAAGQLTCFGGKRNPGEHPDRCIRREIWEELHWRVGALKLELCVKLLGADGKPVAWFYSGAGPGPAVTVQTLPGVECVWLSEAELAAANLSGWHRAALEAERSGQAEARVPVGT
jgi:8-oxo-dGTP pyrophosphatase MutT (NUDIX family)